MFTEYYSDDSVLDLQKLDSKVDDELEVVVDPRCRIHKPFALVNCIRHSSKLAFDTTQ